jgi:hypothetical protein
MACVPPDRLSNDVNRTRHSQPARSLTRVLRSDVARWLVALLIAPILVLGSSSWGTFLAHDHDEHEMHLHSVGVHEDRKLTVADHADDHGHDHAPRPSDVPTDEEQGGTQLAEVPGGILVSFDTCKQLPARAFELGKSLSPAVIFAIIAFVLPRSPDLDPHVGSPGGAFDGGPMNLLALRASERLLRTSRALLI